ncbi:hypothetical protein PF005_g24167 [Phytophthora fragariae]|uniref:Uncharacterized protein n=1 Tax=Phytophthora fragariae TaxID=53985 RepID=A0A6A3E120_9STRA|nr:hypothetical protein PF003_g30409 [Phytophthora fragariae]KAE8925907.1 hypothetical protein PF009_g23889 [Phytophthora fragariae]KAE9074810.1 hypothetical protein PF007_g25257 [Phytophthora fragariae]KAE9077127.1 hypothetical protein PF010_g23634 [Phytophthora fragariae]KAE9098587.1 hypothetical protein PF006_g23330 [Phytophthora fragariae]
MSVCGGGRCANFRVFILTTVLMMLKPSLSFHGWSSSIIPFAGSIMVVMRVPVRHFHICGG